jgi:hypothetical protein
MMAFACTSRGSSEQANEHTSEPASGASEARRLFVTSVSSRLGQTYKAFLCLQVDH